MAGGDLRIHPIGEPKVCPQRSGWHLRENPDAERTSSRLGQRYEPICDREVREILYGHYRFAYLVKSENRKIKLRC